MKQVLPLQEVRPGEPWERGTYKFPKPRVPGLIDGFGRAVIAVDLINAEELDILDDEVNPFIVKLERPYEVLLLPLMRLKKSLS